MRKAAWTIGCALLVCGAATAGQLYIAEFGLRQVRDAGDTVVAGKVTAVRSKKRHTEIDVAVDRVWAGKRGGGPVVGSRRTFSVYQGVEWTDPHKSPIERRLRGGKRTADAGERVIVVPSEPGEVELLAPTDDVIRTLEILFAANPAARVTGEREESLRVALADPDLAEIAAAELQRRGKLDTRALLGAEFSYTRDRYRAMPPAQQRRFVEEATPLCAAEPALRERLADLVLREPIPELLPQLAPLVAQYSFERKEDQRRLEDFRRSLVHLATEGVGDFSPYVEFLADSVRYRPAYRRDEELGKLASRLDARDKARLAALLIERCPLGVGRGRDDTVDGGMLREAATLAEQAPSSSLLAALAKLDPSAPRLASGRGLMMRSMLSIATAVAKAQLGERDRARAIMEPWIDKGLPTEERDLDAWRAVAGPGKKEPPREVSLELGVGQRRNLPSGWRVAVRGTADAIWVDAGEGAALETRRVELTGDWYAEWWLPPYLFVVERYAASDKLRLRLQPLDVEPPIADEATLTAQAEPIAARRGCPDLDRKDYDTLNGRFVYATKGKRGKPCTLIIGARTRKVVRMLP